MGLWAEHLAFLDQSFNDPSSLECVHMVNEAAEKNWEQYTAEEVSDLRGHLLPYPYHVTPEGELSHIEGHETFPDIGGKIMGSQTQLPDNLTT
jgi:phospholipase D1/2